MAEQGRWFKLWCSATDDDDLDNLNVADFGRWCKLGAHIKVHGTNGKLILRPPQRTLCAKLQVNTFEDLILTLKMMPHCTLNEEHFTHAPGMTDASVTYTFCFDNWKKYQEDSSWARMREKREKDADSVTHKKRREEIRGDEIRREEKDGVSDFKFETFWKAYPKDRRVNKKKAYDEWKKEAAHLEEVQRLIMTALPRQIAYKEAMRKQGRFTPEFQDPERWLKNRRWTDEIPDILTREISPTAAWNRPMPKL